MSAASSDSAPRDYNRTRSFEFLDTEGLQPGVTHFNPGIVRFNGRLVMAYRMYRTLDGNTETRIVAVTEELRPIAGSDREVRYPQHAGAVEDMRLVVYEGSLYGIFTDSWRMHIVQFDDDLCVTRGGVLREVVQGRQEKNWNPFVAAGDLCLVYSLSPGHRILRVTDLRDGVWDWDDASSSVTDLRHWQPWGEPRSGTPPLRFGDAYYSFFHSFQWIEPGPANPRNYGIRRYFTGFYSFRAEPPYDILSMSREPVMSSDMSMPGLSWASGTYVHFPTGALFEPTTGIWRVLAGEADRYISVSRYAHADLMVRTLVF